jgi:hypothetical protein
MSLAVTCPHCQRAIDLPEKEAGKIVRCPDCQGAFEVPPVAQPVHEDEPVRRISTTGIPFSAWKALTDDSPPEDEPPPRYRGSFQQPPQPSPPEWVALGAPATNLPPLEAGWGRVSSSLRFIGVLTIGLLGASCLFSCFGLAETSQYSTARDKGPGILLGAIALVGMALYLFALYDMCALPAQSGVRGLMQGTAWVSLAGFGCVALGLLLTLLSSLSTPVGRSPRAEAEMFGALAGMVFFLAAVLLILGTALFLFVLRGIALFFGDLKLAQGVMIYFVCLIILPMAALLVVLCLVAEAGNRRDSLVIVLLAGMLVNTILSIWFYSLVRDVRHRIDSARRRDLPAEQQA